MSIIEEINKKEMDRITALRTIPDFSAGDTLKVALKIIEGTRERIQYFEGLCIGRNNDAIHSSFTVRKISNGEGVERVLPLYSPNIASIEVLKFGKVRRAKLYYQRDRSGKAARIKERTTGHGMKTRNENKAKKKKTA